MRTPSLWLPAGLVVVWLGGCSRPERGLAPVPPQSASASAAPSAAPTPVASATAAPKGSPPRTLHFTWRPPGSDARAYAATDPEDQHRIVLSRGVERGGRYPALIAFHGQPQPGQAPRDYAFARTVTSIVLELVERGEVEPLVLIIPVFRFLGRNWPEFDLVAFEGELARVLGSEQITLGARWLFGHSGAAGCGGDGLNGAHRIHPAAVGFFDTCVGAGFGHEVRELARARVPTLIMHSVETAGFRPRPPTEYMTTFDFGQVYGPLGLRPSEDCPGPLPDVPLRPQPYRCASDAQGTTRAFVVDTGKGQEGHDAVVPVALRYFLRQFVNAPR